MSSPVASAPSNSPPTYWEGVNRAHWGMYLSDLEYNAIDLAARLAKGPENALEVGCDGGRWAKVLEDQGWAMSCTDIDPRSLEICRCRLKRVSCIEVEPSDTTLPCGDESVSLILCMEVFPVIYQNWFIEESWRILVPGGTLVGVFLNLGSWKGLLHRWRCTLLSRNQWYCRTYLSWRRQVKRTGFRFCSQRGLSWMPFSREADAIVIEPASTDFLVKLANGLCDDRLTRLCIPRDCPLLVAPAMNLQMWSAPPTQRNATQLRADCVVVLGPGRGSQG